MAPPPLGCFPGEDALAGASGRGTSRLGGEAATPRANDADPAASLRADLAGKNETYLRDQETIFRQGQELARKDAAVDLMKQISEMCVLYDPVPLWKRLQALGP